MLPRSFLAADEVRDDLHLAGGDAEVFQISVSFHIILRPPSLLALGVAAEGPGRPRAQGRAYRINKRTSHVTLTVAEKA